MMSAGARVEVLRMVKAMIEGGHTSMTGDGVCESSYVCSNFCQEALHRAGYTLGVPYIGDGDRGLEFCDKMIARESVIHGLHDFPGGTAAI